MARAQHLLTARRRALLLFLLLLLPVSLLSVLFWRTGSPISRISGERAAYTASGKRCFWLFDSNAGPVHSEYIGDGTSRTAGKDPDAHIAGGDAQVLPASDIPVSGIEAYMRAHIADLGGSFDAAKAEAAHGLKLGATSLAEYTAELLSNYRTYLGTSSPRPPRYLAPLLSRLALRPPSAPLPDRPRQILTTDKAMSADGLPQGFERWREVMPDWEVRYFDDTGLETWVRKAFGGTRGERVWQALPRQVLKTDVFRQVVWRVWYRIDPGADDVDIWPCSLKEGSIPTGCFSDTAPIIHADLWGYPHHEGTPPLLTHLSRLLSLSNPSPRSSPHCQSSTSTSHEDLPFDSETNGELDAAPPVAIYDAPPVDDGSELGPPALVVSVESDAISFGWDNWRELGLSRAVQITQWTFMARPGHPVFLDALGRTLRKTEKILREAELAHAAGEPYVPETALEWTGPGVFSDCVYRYLLARYGFLPERLVHQKQPIRIGDVLILPAGSFSSVSPFTDEEQREWAASYHGFEGRWRETDPREQLLEKLREMKQQVEEAKANTTIAQTTATASKG